MSWLYSSDTLLLFNIFLLLIKKYKRVEWVDYYNWVFWAKGTLAFVGYFFSLLSFLSYCLRILFTQSLFLWFFFFPNPKTTTNVDNSLICLSSVPSHTFLNLVTFFSGQWSCFSRKLSIVSQYHTLKYMIGFRSLWHLCRCGSDSPSIFPHN